MYQSGELELDITDDGGIPSVRLRGEFDAVSSEAVWAAISALCENGATRVEVDLAGVTFLDSRGIGVLVRAARALNDGCVILREPQKHVRRVLDVAGVADLFAID